MEVTEVVQKLCKSQMNEIHPEMWRSLDIVALVWSACFLSVLWRLGTVPVD